jgi:nucleotide-binding universal stress UspA family protein
MLKAETLATSLSGSGLDPAGYGGALRRIAVPADGQPGSITAVALAARLCIATGGELLVVHVRIYDPPVRGSGRFFPESSEAATSVLDNAVSGAWGFGARARGVVVDAPRRQTAAAISRAASGWDADAIVLTRRARPGISRLVLGSVSDQIMRKADCPVLVVRPA